MTYEFSDWAKDELDEAAAYYERASPGLGLEFLEEIDKAIHDLLDFPDTWAAIVKNVRLCPVSRFPYGIIYFVKDDVIRIVAVMHLHRRPGYWKKRLKKMDP